MHDFEYAQDQLCCEKVRVLDIARQTKTPFYLYSQRTILENFKRLDEAFQPVDHVICYAVKANSNPAVLALLAQRGAGADVVSGGELYLARKAGFDPGKIVFAGVGKRDDEIRYALEQNILALHVESLQELEVINSIAQTVGKKAPVALRVNPNIDIKGHPYISTGTEANKFGIDLPKVRALLSELRGFSNVELVGLHCHVGSMIREVKPYVATVGVLRDLAAGAERGGLRLKYLDIGGGLAVQYENMFAQDPDLISPERLAETLLPEIRPLKTQILFEPGRYLVAEAGILVTRVLYVKESYGKHFVVVDAAMNDLIRPSLYQARHEVVPLVRSGRNGQVVDVVGPVCESGDFLAKERLLPTVQRGDYLAVMTAGAYGFTLSSNYNARPRPPEVLVDGEGFRMVRERGRMENVWSP